MSWILIASFFLFVGFSERQILEKKIEQLEIEISNEEMMSQGQMFEEWHKYTETLERVQKQEKELKLLKEQLEALPKNE